METTVKYYLAARIPFSVPVSASRAPEGFQATGSSSTLGLSLKRKVWRIEGEDTTGGAFAEELSNRQALALQNRPLQWKVDVRAKKSSGGTLQTEFRLTFDGGSDVKDFLGEAALLQVEIFDWHYFYAAPESYLKYNTAEMAVMTSGNQLVCVDSTPNPVIANLLPRSRHQGSRYIAGNMNLLVIDQSYGAPEMRMLGQELGTDAVIIPENGVEVKCHSDCLVAHSDVFQAMFGVEMQESKTRRIEMADMSEEGVRALLASLYRGDLSKAEESCAIALELLMAGHKYNIRILEKAMQKLLLIKPVSWYDVDVAKELFRFVRILDWNLLKKKAVLVLTNKIPDLDESATVLKLFARDPQTAKEFYKYSHSISF